MSSWQRLSAESSDLLEHTGIPRKVMSRLLAALRLGVGFSVLEVGCGRGDLAKFFDSLGIQCTGIDESPKNVLDARRNVPGCTFSCASVIDPLPFLRTEFDVILVRDSSEYHRPLLSRAAYAATLRLISRLPPAGCIAFLCRVGHGEADSSGHAFGCFARALGRSARPSGLSGDSRQFSAGAFVSIAHDPQKVVRALDCRPAAAATTRRAGNVELGSRPGASRRRRAVLRLGGPANRRGRAAGKSGLTMRIFFSVGEPSGDQHAARLIRALKRRRPDLAISGFGGPKMSEAGCDLDFDLTDLAVVGIFRVIPMLWTFYGLVKRAERLFREKRPDAVVLVDFPGFNWWIARKAKAAGIPVFYYLPPQLWGWAPWRIEADAEIRRPHSVRSAFRAEVVRRPRTRGRIRRTPLL